MATKGDISTYAITTKSAWGSPNTRSYYRTCELRSTANYLIDDKTGKRYKRIEGENMWQ